MIRRLFVFCWMCICSLTLLPHAHSAAGECPADGVRIKAEDPNPFDSFGIAVGMSGKTAVVGAFWDDANGFDAGATYVFRQSPITWGQTHKLLTSDPEPGDWFGYIVAIQEQMILSTALQHIHSDDAGTAAVYAFALDSQENWVQIQELLASDGALGDGFGRSLAINGDTAIIGAPSVDADDGFISGAAYVFRFDSESLAWIEEAKLLPPDLPPVPGLGFGFGLDVAIDGDIAVIAEAGDNSACPENLICGSGSVYMFRYDDRRRTWSEEQMLLASDAACGDSFGRAIAVDSNVALIGAPFDDEVAPSAGSVYVFRFDPESSEWVEEQKLVASDGLPGDQFGRALAMDGDLAVIGAWLADPVGNSSGAAYAFRRGPDGVWTEECKLLPEPNGTTQIFGKAIAVDCGRVIIGSKGEDNQSGAAYIYELPTNPADLNNDCDVGAFDLAQLLASWGACPKPCEPGDPAQTCPADLDGDCTVGPADLAMLLGSWG